MSEIYVEGNIGTGKTTFLHFLKKLYENDSVVFEPVDQWTSLTDSDGENILEKFYKDQNRWSFTFQMNSFISRIKKIRETEGIKFVERSVFTDKICFAKNCFKNGKMTKLEYDIYDNWHTWLCDKFEIKAKKFIYLRVEPEISLERIKKRSRKEEEGIPLDYLKQIHDLHESWMKDNVDKGIEVLYLDVSSNFYDNEEEKQSIIEKLYKFQKPS